MKAGLYVINIQKRMELARWAWKVISYYHLFRHRVSKILTTCQSSWMCSKWNWLVHFRYPPGLKMSCFIIGPFLYKWLRKIRNANINSIMLTLKSLLYHTKWYAFTAAVILPLKVILSFLRYYTTIFQCKVFSAFLKSFSAIFLKQGCTLLWMFY